MGFKEDADFARFVSMGAVGAAAVAFDLSDEHGHRMVELERYAAIDDDAETERRMEAVFALTELRDSAAAHELARIADASSLPPEVRAAAAWGLGQGCSRRADLLISLGLDSDETVALHAMAAIEELPQSVQGTLTHWLASEDVRRAELAACLLARHRCIGNLLDACEGSGQARLLALRALGDLPREAVRLHAKERLTPELTAILEPMWYGQDSWLRTTGQEGLAALDVQKVRFDPAAPRGPWMSGTR